MTLKNTKYVVPLICFLLPSCLHAKDDSGFYSMFELGAYKDYIQSGDKRTKTNQTVGKIQANFGYEWQSGWQFGIKSSYAGAGATYNLKGSPLMRGIEDLPYRYNDAAFARDINIALVLGYHWIRSTEHDMYVRLLWNLADVSVLSYAFPFATQASASGFGLEIENRHLLMPKMSIGYTLGVKSNLGTTMKFDGIDEDGYARFGNGIDEVKAKVRANFGLYGDVKWIYHASNSADFFIKWDIQAQFIPKSEEIRTNVYDVLNQRSLGDVSLHTANYRRIRSGISFGAAF